MLACLEECIVEVWCPRNAVNTLRFVHKDGANDVMKLRGVAFPLLEKKGGVAAYVLQKKMGGRSCLRTRARSRQKKGGGVAAYLLS